ncbi:MAG TPA: hypothetical protein VI935_02835, partial [Thermodesulfobacteriota bacterium]|nr:hypothetical protein [Thermodesulfobacteriota bacterium]
MKTKWVSTRNFDAGNYLENFLVAAVAAVLGIRLFLKMTGYPQIGGSSLHIAHMLWGGLLMLVSIIILLSFLNRASERLASIVGGIGFGTFIDEVGKFVTRDNNYFFEPSVAIIYVTFILIFIAIRAIQIGRSYSQIEYLLNALRETQEVVLHDLDEEGKNKALYYLSKSDPSDPLTTSLKNLLSGTKLVPSVRPGLYTRIKLYFRDLYYKITKSRAFSITIVIFFLGQLLVTLAYVIVLVFFVGFGWDKILNLRIFDHVAQRIVGLSFIQWAELFSSLLSGVFVFLGVFYI